MKNETFPLRYVDVEVLLARLHDIPEARIPALKARLQHLQKIGFPAETKTGRGKPACYTASATVKILVAFEVIALRIPPDQAIEILQVLDWSIATELCLKAFDGAPADDVTLAFDPDGLAPLGEREATFNAEWISGDEAMCQLSRRYAIINVTGMLRDAARLLYFMRRAAA